MFYGPSGVGKDCAAYLFASTYLKCPIEHIFPDAHGSSINYKFIEVSACDDRGIDAVREKLTEYASLPLSKDEPRRIIYWNEADGFTPQAYMILKHIEKTSPNCIHIFSLNKLWKMDAAIISRCAFFKFDPITFDEFTIWFADSCKSQNIKYNTNVVDKIYQYYKGDLRRVITDFLDTYHDTEVVYWKPNNDIAAEIFNAKNPREKFLQIMKHQVIDGEQLLEDLFELNGQKNPHLFAIASMSISKSNPQFGILDVIDNALVKQ